MCMYCNEGMNHVFGVIRDGIQTDIFILNDEIPELIAISGNKEDYNEDSGRTETVSEKIHYCPMCGRKLD